MTSLWRALAPEMRLAAVAAAGLGFTLVLPWYSAAPGGGSFSAFNVFTFVEAAVLLVAAGVLYLLYARAKQRAFHLPGGDGTIISAAGAWAAALILWRMFDRPDLEKALSVGIQWGIFLALVAAGALFAAGQRVRAAHRPEPRNPAEEPLWELPPRRRAADRRSGPPREHTEVTRVLEDKPAWEGDEPRPLGDSPPPQPEPEPEPPQPARRSQDQDRLF